MELISHLKINENGDKVWKNKAGKKHREDGPAIEFPDGDKFYYIHGLKHREDGPAIEWANGDKSYYIHDKLHREDGPAIEYASGDKVYYINDRRLTPKQFKKHILKKRLLELI